MPFENDVTSKMPSRRAFLHTASLATAGVVGGCAAQRPPSTTVEVKLLNFFAEPRTVSVVVEQDDEVVFRTERTVSASATPEGEAEILKIPDAFEGTDGEQFTVAVTPAGRPTDTYDYEVTCADADTQDVFSVWILNPESSERGERTSFTVAWCGGR